MGERLHVWNDAPLCQTASEISWLLTQKIRYNAAFLHSCATEGPFNLSITELVVLTPDLTISTPFMVQAL